MAKRIDELSRENSELNKKINSLERENNKFKGLDNINSMNIKINNGNDNGFELGQ